MRRSMGTGLSDSGITGIWRKLRAERAATRRKGWGHTRRPGSRSGRLAPSPKRGMGSGAARLSAVAVLRASSGGEIAMASIRGPYANVFSLSVIAWCARQHGFQMVESHRVELDTHCLKRMERRHGFLGV